MVSTSFLRGEISGSHDDDESESGRSGAAGEVDHVWDNVLVDEVDFVHAYERSRAGRNDLQNISLRGTG